MNLRVDDFSSGSDKIDLVSGSKTSFESGDSILGGNRRTFFWVTGNPQGQTAHLDVGSGSLNVSTGILQTHRLEIGYGIFALPTDPTVARDSASIPGPTDAWKQDLSTYDRIRFHFLANDMLLNFNVELFSGPRYSLTGVNLPANNSPFSQDFLFSSFVGAADFTAIDGLYVVFQSGSAGQDYSILQIEFIEKS